jgi:hypothetical protein
MSFERAELGSAGLQPAVSQNSILQRVQNCYSLDLNRAFAD